ncbi:MAG: hypothetical protein GHCLOJNM_04093 [bacterium]|nr:hypothetical protein [bacterium]
MSSPAAISSRLAAFALALALAAVGGARAGQPVLDSPRLRLAFHPKTGALSEFSLKTPSHEFLSDGSPTTLWQISPMHGPPLRAERAASFSARRDLAKEDTLELIWSGFGHPEAPDLRVVARVTLDPEHPTVCWRIRLERLAGMKVRAVHFPRIGGIKPQAGESLAVPEWMGKETHRARSLLSPEGEAAKRREWEYPGLLSMQCLAWCGGEGPGLLLSTQDPSALRKQFAVFGEDQGGIGLEVIHQPPVENKPIELYEPPYDTLLSAFSGSWYEAAREYSRWARGQAWVHESRRKKGLTPEWATDTGLWVWNRGRSQGVLVPAAKLQEEARIPVSVFWHWWHGCAYDAGFPEYLPPREGNESFRSALALAREQGVRSLVYMNQRLWGMTTGSWSEEGAERFAVKGPDGKVAPEVYNTFMKVPCASMCMGTPFWREKYRSLAVAAFDLGVDGIYMDQACSSLSCYDPAHGHPLGGGSYWMEGFRALAASIREGSTGDRRITLAGEGCGEAWLPHLDLMLSLQVSMERYAAPGDWEPIPFFQSVYHDCALLYGNYSSLTHPPYDDLWPAEFAPREPLALLDRKFAAQFRLEQARALVWGQQLTLANFTPRLLEERREEMDFFLALARLHAKTRAYLRDGTMLKPPVDTLPSAQIPVSRLSIYAGQQGAVKEYVATVPMVLAGAWLAEDGRIGVALVNISDQPQRALLSLRQSDYPISVSGTIRRIEADAEKDLGRYADGKVELEEHLDPASACLIEVAPDTAPLHPH